MITSKINIVSLAETGLRLDASCHLAETIRVKKLILNSPFPSSPLKDQVQRIFIGNIFKRIYVNNPERGVAYVTGSDMIKTDINSGKFISKKQAENLQYLFLEKSWILLSC